MEYEIINLLLGFAVGLGVGWWLSYAAMLRMIQQKKEFEDRIIKMEKNIIEYMDKEGDKDESGPDN